MADLNDQQVVGLLRSKGPLVVNDIRKALKTDSFLVGATLSSLLSRKVVKVTHLKKGSSPFYYVPTQEPLLEKFIDQHNSKDQAAIQKLRESQVLRDRDLELIDRVALRQVKDFAKEVVAQVPGGQILFWRYYLLTEAQAIELIKERYWHTKKEEPAPAKETEQESVATVVPEHEMPQEPPIVVEDVREESPKPTVQPTPVAKEVPTKPITIPKKEQAQTKLSEEPAPIKGSPFYDDVIAYFKAQDIQLVQQEQIAKDREYGFVVTVPSAVGELKMYCRARNKKKLNEGDVAPALLKAKQLDLPCLFLTGGSFTKKSLALIEKEYSGVLLQYLE